MVVCVGNVISQVEGRKYVKMLDGYLNVFRDVVGDATTEGCCNSGKSLGVKEIKLASLKYPKSPHNAP